MYFLKTARRDIFLCPRFPNGLLMALQRRNMNGFTSDVNGNPLPKPTTV
jgi:hypothetical protein